MVLFKLPSTVQGILIQMQEMLIFTKLPTPITVTPEVPQSFLTSLALGLC